MRVVSFEENRDLLDITGVVGNYRDPFLCSRIRKVTRITKHILRAFMVKRSVTKLNLDTFVLGSGLGVWHNVTGVGARIVRKQYTFVYLVHDGLIPGLCGYSDCGTAVTL